MTTVDPQLEEARERVRQIRGTVHTIAGACRDTLDRYRQLLDDLERHTLSDAIAAAFGPGRSDPSGGSRPSGHADPTSTATPRLHTDPILQAHRAAWDAERKALERRCQSLERYLDSLTPDPTPTQDERRKTDLMMLHQYPRPA